MTSNRSTGKLKFSGGSLAAALLVGGALMLSGSAGPSLALPVSPAAIGTAADGIDSVITMARRGGGARAGGGARVSHSAGVSRSARVGHGARVSHAKVNRTTNVRTRTNVNVNRVTNVNVGRGLVR